MSCTFPCQFCTQEVGLGDLCFYGELVLFQAWKSPGVEGRCNTKQKEPAVSLRAMTSHHSWVRPFATDLLIYYFLIVNPRSRYQTG